MPIVGGDTVREAETYWGRRSHCAGGGITVQEAETHWGRRSHSLRGGVTALAADLQCIMGGITQTESAAVSSSLVLRISPGL